MKLWMSLAVLLAASLAAPASADWTDARCDIYPAASDRLEKMIPCTFGQKQGYITITRDDGVTHELEPVGDASGNFRDQDGRAVYRQSGLGDQGQVFRFPDESVFVYWSTAGLEPDTDNATAPFSTAVFDATTLLRCRDASESEFSQCPAGILRMEGNQASIVVQNRKGEQFTINFMTGHVNASNGTVAAELNGDTWTVTVDGNEVYEVPLAAIEGG
jgi:hypothetical protein